MAFSRIVVLPAVVASVWGCGGEESPVGLDVVLRNEQRMSGEPVEWHRDYVTLDLADGLKTVWRSDILRAETTGGDGEWRRETRPEAERHGVWWRFDSSKDPVEIIEGCDEVIRDEAPSRGMAAICRRLDEGGIVIPRQTFAIAAWSLEELEKEPLLVIEPRAFADGGEVDGSLPEIQFTLPSPEPDSPPTPEPPTPDPSALEPPREAESWAEIHQRLQPEVREHPEDVATQLAYLQACFEIGRLEEARRWLERLLRDAPAQPEYLYWEGVLEVAEGEASKAVTLLEDVKLRVRQELPEVYMYLGLAYAQLGDDDNLCLAFREYLQRARSRQYNEVVEAQIERHCQG